MFSNTIWADTVLYLFLPNSSKTQLADIYKRYWDIRLEQILWGGWCLEFFNRRRWTTRLAQTWMECCHARTAYFSGFEINATAYCLSQYSLHLLLLESSMAQWPNMFGMLPYTCCIFLGFVITHDSLGIIRADTCRHLLVLPKYLYVIILMIYM